MDNNTKEPDNTPIILEVPTDDLYICTNIHEGQLPPLLEDAVKVAELPYQQDILLLTALTATGYAMPHIKMLHEDGSKYYYPNLMSLIVAPPASGKGLVTHAQQLIDPIDKVLRASGKTATIAADSSSVTFFEILQECGGNAFMLATETDELSQAMKKDGGMYSSLFRKAAEHEKWMRTRYRGNKKKTYRLDEPKLSALITGTDNQVRPLLGNGENGLLSRFMLYTVDDLLLHDENVLKHNDKPNPDGAMAVYDRLGQEVLSRWDWLRGQDHDCLWILTDRQVDAFNDLIVDAKQLAIDWIEARRFGHPKQMVTLMLAMTNRLMTNLKRIGMILTALRLEPWDALPQTITCSDDDFKTMMLLGEKLMRHALHITESLVERAPNPELNVLVRSDAAERMDRLFEKLPTTFKYAKIKSLCDELEITERTLKRYLNDLIEAKKLSRLSRGNYKKMN